jgi:hypothetical protein
MAVAQGMGGATRASLDDGGSVYTAPATIWLNGGFDVSGGARIGSDGSRLYQASALDAQTGPVGLGIQWLRLDSDSSPDPDELPGWKQPGQSLENPTSTTVYSAALAVGGVHHLVGFAAGLRYYSRTAPVTGDESELNAVVSMGVTVRDQLILTLTGENLVPQSGYDGAPLGVGIGARWQPTDTFAVALDTLTDLESKDDGAAVSPMLGAEYRIRDTVPVRVGWGRDGVSGQAFMTAGLGVSNAQAGLDYGAKLALVSRGKPAHWHGLSLRLSF